MFTTRFCLTLSLALSLILVSSSGVQAKHSKKDSAKATATSTAASSEPTSIVPRPRDQEKEWMPKHDKLVKKAKSCTAELVFFGDSITEGMDLNQLKKIFGPSTENFGIGGDRTQHLLWRFQHDELKFKKNPKIMVMLIGTNNFKTWPGWTANTNEEIVQGVKADIKEAQRKIPGMKILILGLLPRDEKADSPLRDAVKKVNEMLKPLADNKKVYFVDIGDKLLQADGSIAKTVMPDFLHPTPEGYETMLTAIKPTIESMKK